MSSPNHPNWTPPHDPDPQLIFKEAKADAAAERFAEALAKHVWFHENALKLRPSLSGVRLSFALHAWAELGAVFPPALAKLRSMRDEAGRSALAENGYCAAFRDFRSINEILGEEEKTKDLFIWFDANKPEVAKEVFRLAQPSLIRAGEYRRCGGYLDADADFEWISTLRRAHLKFGEDTERGEEMQVFGRKKFSNATATLIALLIVNERRAEAERIRARALEEWDDSEFKNRLDDAMLGRVPSPWP